MRFFASRRSVVVAVAAVIVGSASSSSSSSSSSWIPDDPDNDANSCVNDHLEGVEEETRVLLTELSEHMRGRVRWTVEAVDEAKFAASLGGPKSATFGHTRPGGTRRLLEEWRRRQSGGSVIIDLGSGAGHSLLQAAVLDRNCTLRGYELSASRTAAAVDVAASFGLRHPELGLGRVSFHSGDMLDAPIGDADLVWVSSLLLGDLTTALKAKLRDELRPGAVVLTSLALFDDDDGDLATTMTRVVAPMSWSSQHHVHAYTILPQKQQEEDPLVLLLENLESHDRH